MPLSIIKYWASGDFGGRAYFYIDTGRDLMMERILDTQVSEDRIDILAKTQALPNAIRRFLSQPVYCATQRITKSRVTLINSA
jgi:hypothetical protein